MNFKRSNPDNIHAFEQGKTAKALEIQEMGFNASRDKFNADYPAGFRSGNPQAYFYAEGEMQALVEGLQ